MKTRLMHVRANVRDLQRAIDWYRETLGFEVSGLWPPDKPDYAGFVAGEGATFSIMEAEPVPTGPSRPVSSWAVGCKRLSP